MTRPSFELITYIFNEIFFENTQLSRHSDADGNHEISPTLLSASVPALGYFHKLYHNLTAITYESAHQYAIMKSYALSTILAAIASSTIDVAAFSPTSINSRRQSLSSTRAGSNQELYAKKKIFIDGEAGTTGLQVRDRLAKRDDLEIISIADELRKDVNERKRLINEADCVILCLPDDASKEAASMVENDNTVVIDASTAFRVDDDWTYGFPELSKSQKDAVKSSKRISNPGCYPTGFIALVKPLVDAGIIPVDAPITVNAVSGYSGGGNALIGIYESDDHEPWGAYGYSMNHKHIPGK